MGTLHRGRAARARTPRRIVTIITGLGIGALIATAATLGGIRVSQLTGYAVAAAPDIPTVYAWDPFTAPNNTNLNGRVAPVGGTWTVHAGTWRLNANQANMTTVTTNGRATLNVGVTDYAVTIDSPSFPTGARRSGVALRVNSAGTQGLYVEIRNINGGQLAIGSFTATAATPLATVNGIGAPGSFLLRVEVEGNQVRAYLNGVLVSTYTLTAAQMTTYGANTRVGLWANGDKQTTFASFLVESLP
ncbi:MAG TPA: hypothetical protein VFZ83_10480 [Acidimicrobiia bacterium]|nr:hypothetical protein [Acidimicrobiia bacterium]